MSEGEEEEAEETIEQACHNHYYLRYVFGEHSVYLS